MENLKHTKGEWLADKEEGSWAVYSNRTRNICSIKNRASIEGNSENEANAKLIASAPELLEALIELKYELTGEQECEEELEKRLGIHLYLKVVKAINAINKATK